MCFALVGGWSGVGSYGDLLNNQQCLKVNGAAVEGCVQMPVVRFPVDYIDP